MIILKIYLIGCWIAFILTFFMKKDEVKYSKETYNKDITNGEWIFISLGMSVASWLTVLAFIWNKFVNFCKGTKPIIKLNKWLHQKIEV